MPSMRVFGSAAGLLPSVESNDSPGYLVQIHWRIPAMSRTVIAIMMTLSLAAPLGAAADEKKESRPDNTPPEGFVALFNGKDLTGWKGLLKDPLDSPKERAKATPEKLAEAQKEADQNMRDHWTVHEGVLVFEPGPMKTGRSLATAKDYGDFEMMVDWKIKEGGDSGIYLRGTPQVQIWDPGHKSAGGVGSGGLYNNKDNPSTPT